MLGVRRDFSVQMLAGYILLPERMRHISGNRAQAFLSLSKVWFTSAVFRTKYIFNEGENMIQKLDKYKHVIWDWNGTLLDDVWLAIEVMNNILRNRNLIEIDSKRYKEIFDFPVIKYYALLGFDFRKEQFTQLASEFVDEYNSRCLECNLFTGAEKTLQVIYDSKVTQSILSASSQATLIKTVKEYGIEHLFEKIIGLDNYYAESKLDIGKAWIKDKGFQPNEVLLIGDTIHDYEVSKSIGCDYLIIANGHQSYERLEEARLDIVESINSLEGMF